MVYHHFCAPALLWVLLQALINEILELGGPVWRDARRLALNYIEQDASLLLRDVRRLALRQLYREDAERPDVDLVRVAASALDQLRRHPANGADFTLAALLLLRQHHGVAKVRQLDLAVGLAKDVVGLDISVNDIVLVQVDQALAGGPQAISAKVLRVRAHQIL